MRRRLLLVLAVIGCQASVVAADTVTLRDGTKIEGDLKRTPDGWEVTTADGKKRQIPAMKVKGVELSPAAGATLEKLESLRRSVAFSEELPKIIERYKRFIDQNKGTPLEAPARQDLAVWQDRFDRKLVKAGTKWLTPEQSRALTIASLRSADAARALMSNKNYAGAERLLAETLEADPRNPSAIYLQSVLQLHAGQVPAARKGFEAVVSRISDHAPSLNNIAVILFRQKQFGGALTFYLQAIIASPDNRLLLDNVAEALAALPEAEQKTPQAQKLNAAFVAQDQTLQKRLREKGEFRWGASWVDRETFDKLKAAEAAIQKRLAALQADFELTSDRVKRAEADIRSTQQALSEIESRSYVRAGDGTLVRVPYPQAYYDLQREVSRLQADRSEALARLDALRAEAKKTEADFPVPKFSGVQQTVGEEGVPFVLPDGVTPEDVFPPKDAPPSLATPPATQRAPEPVSQAVVPPLLARPGTQPATAPAVKQ